MAIKRKLSKDEKIKKAEKLVEELKTLELSEEEYKELAAGGFIDKIIHDLKVIFD